MTTLKNFEKKKIQCGTHDLVFSTASKIRVVTVAPGRGLRGIPLLPGDFRVIVCPTPPQMNDFYDLLSPDAPVSKIYQQRQETLWMF